MKPVIANRFVENPLLRPADVRPSRPGLEVACLLNPGVFEFDNKIWLIIRVAERPKQQPDFISFPILRIGGIEIMEIAINDPHLNATDARILRYKGNDYLTTLSHLRLFCSDDGIHFREAEGYPQLHGEGPLETFGLEDCRVTKIADLYYLTFTAVSPNGVGVGMRTTRDWKIFSDQGMIIPPHNKDCALFDEKITVFTMPCTGPAAWTWAATTSGWHNRRTGCIGANISASLKRGQGIGTAHGWVQARRRLKQRKDGWKFTMAPMKNMNTD